MKGRKKGCQEKSEYMQSNRSELNLFNGMSEEFVNKPTCFLISLFMFLYMPTYYGIQKDS